MIEISFLTGEMLLLAGWLLARALVWLARKNIDWRREAQLLPMLINLGVIVRFAFYPMRLVNGRVEPLVFDPDMVFPLWINLRPLVHLFDFASTRDLLLNGLGNIAMFIPTGILIPILYSRRNTFWKVLVSGALISLCIEIIQLPFYVRSTDIDDLILNTTGVALGYGVYALARAISGRGKKHS